MKDRKAFAYWIAALALWTQLLAPVAFARAAANPLLFASVICKSDTHSDAKDPSAPQAPAHESCQCCNAFCHGALIAPVLISHSIERMAIACKAQGGLDFECIDRQWRRPQSARAPPSNL
jgi:hypothetical protein